MSDLLVPEPPIDDGEFAALLYFGANSCTFPPSPFQIQKDAFRTWYHARQLLEGNVETLVEDGAAGPFLVSRLM
jgi:hypothetical protein